MSYNYVFIEYPKWIKVNGKDLIVESKEEEDKYVLKHKLEESLPIKHEKVKKQKI